MRNTTICNLPKFWYLVSPWISLEQIRTSSEFLDTLYLFLPRLLTFYLDYTATDRGHQKPENFFLLNLNFYLNCICFHYYCALLIESWYEYAKYWVWSDWNVCCLSVYPLKSWWQRIIDYLNYLCVTLNVVVCVLYPVIYNPLHKICVDIRTLFGNHKMLTS